MFTPQGAQKNKTLARVQTRTEINEVESAKSELTYPDKGASRKRERADEAPSYSSRRSARVESQGKYPHRFFVATIIVNFKQVRQFY